MFTELAHVYTIYSHILVCDLGILRPRYSQEPKFRFRLRVTEAQFRHRRQDTWKVENRSRNRGYSIFMHLNPLTWISNHQPPGHPVHVHGLRLPFTSFIPSATCRDPPHPPCPRCRPLLQPHRHIHCRRMPPECGHLYCQVSS